MRETLLREWKKVFEDDLKYITYELKELIESKSVVILEGDLGAGKTTFCKNFIGEDQTFSPSYSVLQESNSVLHADLYRIESSSELLPLELNLYLEDKSTFLVEWGMKYINSLSREVPDDFNYYVLKIDINKADGESDSAKLSRNFSVHAIQEI